MPRFSEECFKKLSFCHRDLQTLFYEVVKHNPCVVVKIPEKEEEGLLRAIHIMPINEQEQVEWDDVFKNIYFAGAVDMCAAILQSQGKIQHSIRKTGTDKYEVVA